MVLAACLERQRRVSGAGQLCLCDDEPGLCHDRRQRSAFAGGCQVFCGVDRPNDRYDLSLSRLEFACRKRVCAEAACGSESGLRKAAITLRIPTNLYQKGTPRLKMATAS